MTRHQPQEVHELEHRHIVKQRRRNLQSAQTLNQCLSNFLVRCYLFLGHHLALRTVGGFTATTLSSSLYLPLTRRATGSSTRRLFPVMSEATQVPRGNLPRFM